jgi:hypothetical protein
MRIAHLTFCGLLLAVAVTVAQEPLRLPATVGSGAAATTEWDLDGSGKWTVRDGLLVLEAAGTPAGKIRRPSAIAVLRSEPFGDVTLSADVRCTAAMPDKTPRRDVELIFGYQSPTRFYYVHLSATRDDVHNGIFVVNDADRHRIDTKSDVPILQDQAWHRVRVHRALATGRIEVFADDKPDPIMIATDTTLGAGRVGVGSFDDTGEFRAIRVTK